MKYFIAIDIGGTQLRAAVYPDSGTSPISVERIPTKFQGENLITRLSNLIERNYPKNGDVLGIGVAAPGPADTHAGIVYNMPNIPGYDNLPLGPILHQKFNTKVQLGNDATLAALGEWRYGAGIGHHNIIYMTISTGIGGGVICDGKLLLGHHGLAAELGHITILPDGPICSCGKRGHLEAIASGTAIANYVKERLAEGMPSSLSGHPNPTAKEISHAAMSGDSLAKAALARAGTFLGISISNYLHIFNPSIIILGGGVSQSGELLLDPVYTSIRQSVLAPEYVNELIITTAKLGDDAGLMGALSLVREGY